MIQQLFYEDGLKLLISLIMGSLIGLEREYRSKAAGFRTITLISIGSALFTIVSVHLGAPNNADRIAANIITGIGFLGAGVVFKDGFSVTGLTTATTIWATAALGMAVGSGEYIISFEALILIMFVLSVFEYVQRWIDNFHQQRTYRIVFKDRKHYEIERALKDLKISYVKRKETKLNEGFVAHYDVYGKREKLDQFNAFLLNFELISSFDC